MRRLVTYLLISLLPVMGYGLLQSPVEVYNPVTKTFDIWTASEGGGTFAPGSGGGGVGATGIWSFDTATSGDPGNKDWRFNNATQTSSTEIAINENSEGDVDFANILALLETGDRVYVQEQKKATNFHLLSITADPTDQGAYFTIPITFDDSGANIGSGKKCIIWFIFSGDGTETDPVWTASSVATNVSVTQAVDLDTIESDTATNNAKATNVSTALSVGTVTASTVAITSDGGADDVVIPAATTTTGGIVGIATATETTTGTDTGLAVTPSSLPIQLQDNKYTFAVDAEASDTYVITLSPAPAAYAAGQVFHFDANTINTGAASLNVNALGAKTIVKHHDLTLASGDIEAGQHVTVMYDGTNFQMLSQLGNVPAGGGGGMPFKTFILITPHHFIQDNTSDGAKPVQANSTFSSIAQSDINNDYYAYIEIPEGHTATEVIIYSDLTSAFTVYEASVNTGTLTSKGSANMGSLADITDVAAGGLNYLVIEINGGNANIRGGKVTLIETP